MDLQICRLCLQKNKNIYDIFTSKKINITICEMLSSCTKLRPCQGDGLPHVICKKCYREIKRIYKFNLKIQYSDKKLRKYLKRKLQSDIKDTSEEGCIKNDEFKKEKLEKLDTQHIFEYEVKQEPFEADDSSWDAEDENFLKNIKQQNTSDEIADREPLEVPEDEPKRKKRSGKRKCGVEDVPESKLPHQCDVCGKFLSTKSNLKAHKICHTDQRPYQCNVCDAAFRGHSALFHHRKMHTGETPHHCEYCPKRFKRRAGLLNHIRVHTGEKTFSCEICRKSFAQSAQLSTHLRRHKGEKPYLCQDCGKGFSIKADLKVHQRIHNGERPYACHLCSKTFSTSGNLSIHVRIHKKEIRYSCKECGRGFVTCSSFNVHMKRHRGQRDYRCDCGKTFYTSSALKVHMVVHTGEKNYQCKICQRKFSQASHLSRHFKRDHAKTDVPLPPAEQYKLVIGTDTSKMLSSETSAGVKCED